MNLEELQEKLKKLKEEVKEMNIDNSRIMINQKGSAFYCEIEEIEFDSKNNEIILKYEL